MSFHQVSPARFIDPFDKYILVKDHPLQLLLHIILQKIFCHAGIGDIHICETLNSIVFGGFWLILLFENFEILDEVEVIYAWFREDGKPFLYCIPCQAPYKGKAWHPSWPGGEKSMLIFVR